MFSLLKRRKILKTPPNRLQERIAKCLVDAILRWQKESAIWLQQKSERLPKKAKLIILSAFVGLAGGYNIFLIASNGYDLSNSGFTSKTVPRMLGRTLSTEEHRQLHNFKLHVDFLRASEHKRLYDSIINAQSGIPDSILFIEKNYELQNKK